MRVLTIDLFTDHEVLAVKPLRRHLGLQMHVSKYMSANTSQQLYGQQLHVSRCMVNNTRACKYNTVHFFILDPKPVLAPCTQGAGIKTTATHKHISNPDFAPF